MEFHTHNLLSSRKAQFFVLTAFTIVTILYFISKWIEPYTIIDTSIVALRDEPFIFNNIKEKTIETVKLSKSCEELEYNLDEYKNFVKGFASSKNLDITFDYTITKPCDKDILETSFNITFVSSSIKLQSSFVTTK